MKSFKEHFAKKINESTKMKDFYDFAKKTITKN